MTLELNIFNFRKKSGTYEDDKPEETSAIEALVKKNYSKPTIREISNTPRSKPNVILEKTIAHTSAWSVKPLPLEIDEEPREKPTEPSKLALNLVPAKFKYAYLGDNETWLVVISSTLTKEKEEKLL